MRHCLWIACALLLWSGCTGPGVGQKEGQTESAGAQERTLLEWISSENPPGGESPGAEVPTVDTSGGNDAGNPSDAGGPSESGGPSDTGGTSEPTKVPDDTQVPDTAGGVDRSVGPEGAPSPDVAAGSCQGMAGMKSGETTWKLKHDGVTRSFRVFIPPQYDGKKQLPVLLNFHGLSMTGSQQQLVTSMNALAAKQGFVAVHPDGRGVPQSWNGGLCCSPASSLLKSKDVDFTRAMLDEMQAKLCLDASRVYATGISNGAYMAYRLACDLSDRITAIAPVAGLLLSSPCRPKRPLSVIHFHGTADLIVPYEGRKLVGWPSAKDSIQVWIKHNACPSQPKQVFNNGDTTCEEYGPCKGGTKVRLCVVKNGGHTWPGGTPLPGMGKTTKDINASAEIWKFFSPHRIP